MRTPWLFLTLLLPSAAWSADEIRNTEAAHVRMLYEHGKYEEALQQGEEDETGWSDTDRADVHRYAGLAAFNINKTDDAARHFKKWLRIDPDADLDPFVVTPAAIKFFEEVRTQMARELEALRLQKRLRASELAREKAAEAERKRQLEELSRKVTTRNVEKRSFLVNFVPFGAGQFQQGRIRAGIAFLGLEGGLALTSIISWIWRIAVVSSIKVPVQNTLTGDTTVTETGVPPNLGIQARNWSYAQYISASAFYTVYAFGVAEAIYRHEDQVQTGVETTILPPGAPIPSSDNVVPPAPARPPGAFLFPT